MRQDYSHEQSCLRLVSNMIRSIKLIGQFLYRQPSL